MRRRALACLALMAATALVYGRVAGHEFVHFDTLDYVLENRPVLAGLTVDGARWAFAELHAANWHPLTWLSHMLDVELFGLNPAGHHLVSVALHGLSAALLFLVLERATGRAGPSLFTAFVFALHPLHVESVAWVAERKDVLSTFLGLASLWFWVGHARESSRARYSAALGLFALGLMAKPMLVTLPFLMLLFDVWPLERLAARGWRALVLEKVPFFVLAAASCWITLIAQERGGAVQSFDSHGLGVRLSNAAHAYSMYAWKTVWPTDLAVWYPHARGALPAAAWIPAALVLPAITAAVFALRRRLPYLLCGWLWFLGTLVPVIGLVQVGGQSWADRYAYVPQTGLVLAVAFGAADLLRRWRHAGAALAAAVLAPLALLTWSQLGLWHDTDRLFEHTARVTERNYVAHNVLGMQQQRRGNLKAAVAQFRVSLSYKPGYAEAFNNLGRAMMELGELEEARLHFERGIAAMPGNADAYHQLGILHGLQGESEQAERLFRRALAVKPSEQSWFNLALELERRGEIEQAAAGYLAALEIDPGFARAHTRLGLLRMRQGRDEEARAHLEAAVRFDPDDGEARHTLGGLLARTGREAEAIAVWEEALELEPERTVLLNGIAWVLATSADDRVRSPGRAVELAERACAASADPTFLDTLSAAYAASGRFDEALETARRALELARSSERESLAGRIERRIALYEQGRPYRATSP